MRSMKFLGNWILDFDGFDGFVELRKRVAPFASVRNLLSDPLVAKALPFFGRDNLDYTGLHSIFVDLVDEFLETFELLHCL